MTGRDPDWPGASQVNWSGRAFSLPLMPEWPGTQRRSERVPAAIPIAAIVIRSDEDLGKL